jgi:large subunit ribosomal protein L17
LVASAIYTFDRSNLQRKMRHGMVYRRLSRSPKHLIAMLRNLTGSLIEYEAIKTTVPRAKELKRYAERVITQGKKGNEVEVRKVLYQEHLIKKLLFDIAPRFSDREGGYTRVLKCGPRKNDQAEMAIIELVGRVGEIRPKASSAVENKPEINVVDNTQTSTKTT